MANSIASVSLYLAGICRADVNIGGWGVVLVAGKNKKTLYGGHFGVGSGENVKGDLMAMHGLMHGLAAITMPTKIQVLTPSQYVVDVCSKWLPVWVENGWKTKAGEEVPNKDMLQAVAGLLAKHQVVVVHSPDGSEGIFADAGALASQGIDERLDEGRSSTPVSTETQKKDAAPTVKADPAVRQIATEAAAKSETDSHLDVMPTGAETSEADTLRSLLRECLPILCGGLSLSFIKKNDPTSLAVRVAVATE